MATQCFFRMGHASNHGIKAERGLRKHACQESCKTDIEIKDGSASALSESTLAGLRLSGAQAKQTACFEKPRVATVYKICNQNLRKIKPQNAKLLHEKK